MQRGIHDGMVVRFTTAYAINTYYNQNWRNIIYHEVCQ